MTNETANENVVNPKHYDFFDDIKAIQVIAMMSTIEEFRGFCMLNAMKYRLRCGKKDPSKIREDLKKSDQQNVMFNEYKNLCRDVSIFNK